MSDFVECSFLECDRPMREVGTGLCSGHAEQRRTGRSLVPLKNYVRGAKRCTRPNCDEPTLAKGMCGAHYARHQRGADIDAPLVLRSPKTTECAVRGCTEPVRTRGMCQLHYARHWRGTTPLDAPKLRRGEVWGDWTTDSNGYVIRRMTVTGMKSAGYSGRKKIQFQHRVFWEGAYGPLLPGQNIHHKNGDRSDNRLENLEVWDTSQPAGQRPEDKLEFARMMFERYASDGEVWISQRTNRIEGGTR